MVNELDGKVAIVTGGASGIGRGIVERFMAEGSRVVIADIEADMGEQLAATLGSRAIFQRTDVSDPEQVGALIATTVEKFGGLHVMVNNAAVYDFVPLDKVTEAHFDRMFGLNVRGLLFTTQAAADAFGDRGGSIINIGSMASLSPPPGGSIYSATKGAVDVLTRSLAGELGPKKILVNAVLPGPVETEGTQSMAEWSQFKAMLLPMTPLGRIGQPRDIATVVSFLASEDAGWITGQILQAAGGLR